MSASILACVETSSGVVSLFTDGVLFVTHGGTIVKRVSGANRVYFDCEIFERGGALSITTPLGIKALNKGALYAIS